MSKVLVPYKFRDIEEEIDMVFTGFLAKTPADLTNFDSNAKFLRLLYKVIESYPFEMVCFELPFNDSQLKIEIIRCNNIKLIIYMNDQRKTEVHI